MTESAGERSAEEKRRDQLTAAPKSTDDDARPRIDVSETAEGAVRIDIRDDSPVRPGGDPDLV
ncbi:MAG: hypothetical protein EPO52_06390 [Herbiconiux sp.]|uniref:hypothetical protein n=1 Tax=Herbiconiux sp. TaxID=1871186 RepID=UPI0011F7C7BA|nr:hypothetical protein [Herbiconiux sp.]TAJ47831.1 MAG: hypothetical protein EPO52_06390 [Herbiconiux sp.]